MFFTIHLSAIQLSRLTHSFRFLFITIFPFNYILIYIWFFTQPNSHTNTIRLHNDFFRFLHFLFFIHSAFLLFSSSIKQSFFPRVVYINVENFSQQSRLNRAAQSSITHHRPLQPLTLLRHLLLLTSSLSLTTSLSIDLSSFISFSFSLPHTLSLTPSL